MSALNSLASIEARAGELREEARLLIEDSGLPALLARYGEPRPTGSYTTGLMAWRDLDFELLSDDLDVRGFFRLGGELATSLKPARMQYRDEYVAETEGLPRGRYWGIYLPGENAWKIDLWVMDREEHSRRADYTRWLEDNLTSERRRAILLIKSAFWDQPGYRRAYSSADIYKAVIEDGIDSPDAFRAYLKSMGKL